MKGMLELSIQDSNWKTFNHIVISSQEKYLGELLGYPLYGAFNTAIIAGGSIPEKWTNLLNGADYTIEYHDATLPFHWDGMKNMLKYFMFYDYLAQTATKNTSEGETKKSNYNSENASAYGRMNDAFLLGWKLYGMPFIEGSKKQFATQTRKQAERNKLYPSAYNFINAMNEADSTTYPNWYFTEKTLSNNFGL